ncbi:MAG: NADH:ubiquinone reductase (Na(+)-transporting) subunit B [Bryobacterales bacterium]|nr:NADH:ubiquinone reductase (Na(+)-transporting) subunit B [Bryobacterales bacterium]
MRKFLDSLETSFKPGGRLEGLYPLFEAADTFLYTPGSTTRGASHVRDGIDVKRMMVTVVLALLPCVAMALYNTGYQANLAISLGAQPLATWQTTAMEALGFGGFDPANVVACVLHGALYYLPVVIVTFAVGGNCEALFAVVRKHEINEGFLVTGMLFPLVLPPTVPLWQVALGIAFGVIIGKEIFGGTGMNIFNPALMSRAFLFFAYPAQISGDQVWIAADTTVDGSSGATWLARSAVDGPAALVDGGLTWKQAFIGLVPGSMGETSTLACLLGALLLILTGIGSWRIMAAGVVGSFLMVQGLNALGSTTNPLMNVPFEWHVVLGGWAFGLVFMATDPVSSAHTNKGRYVYGFCIGVLAILIRVINPAYPEGMMLAILFMNMFAALIDHFVVQANVKRRRARYAS